MESTEAGLPYAGNAALHVARGAKRKERVPSQLGATNAHAEQQYDSAANDFLDSHQRSAPAAPSDPSSARDSYYVLPIAGSSGADDLSERLTSARVQSLDRTQRPPHAAARRDVDSSAVASATPATLSSRSLLPSRIDADVEADAVLGTEDYLPYEELLASALMDSAASLVSSVDAAVVGGSVTGAAGDAALRERLPTKTRAIASSTADRREHSQPSQRPPLSASYASVFTLPHRDSGRASLSGREARAEANATAGKDKESTMPFTTFYDTTSRQLDALLALISSALEFAFTSRRCCLAADYRAEVMVGQASTALTGNALHSSSTLSARKSLAVLRSRSSAAEQPRSAEGSLRRPKGTAPAASAQYHRPPVGTVSSAEAALHELDGALSQLRECEENVLRHVKEYLRLSNVLGLRCLNEGEYSAALVTFARAEALVARGGGRVYRFLPDEEELAAYRWHSQRQQERRTPRYLSSALGGGNELLGKHREDGGDRDTENSLFDALELELEGSENGGGSSATALSPRARTTGSSSQPPRASPLASLGRGKLTVLYFPRSHEQERRVAVAAVENNLGLYHFTLGEYKSARDRFAKALAAELALGPAVACTTGITYLNLSQSLWELRDYSGALAAVEDCERAAEHQAHLAREHILSIQRQQKCEEARAVSTREERPQLPRGGATAVGTSGGMRRPDSRTGSSEGRDASTGYMDDEDASFVYGRSFSGSHSSSLDESFHQLVEQLAHRAIPQERANSNFPDSTGPAPRPHRTPATAQAEAERQLMSAWVRWRESVCLLSRAHAQHGEWLHDHKAFPKASVQYDLCIRWLTAVPRLSAAEQRWLARMKSTLNSCRAKARRRTAESAQRHPGQRARRGDAADLSNISSHRACSVSRHAAPPPCTRRRNGKKAASLAADLFAARMPTLRAPYGAQRDRQRRSYSASALAAPDAFSSSFTAAEVASAAAARSAGRGHTDVYCSVATTLLPRHVEVVDDSLLSRCKRSTSRSPSRRASSRQRWTPEAHGEPSRFSMYEHRRRRRTVDKKTGTDEDGAPTGAPQRVSPHSDRPPWSSDVRGVSGGGGVCQGRLRSRLHSAIHVQNRELNGTADDKAVMRAARPPTDDGLPYEPRAVKCRAEPTPLLRTDGGATASLPLAPYTHRGHPLRGGACVCPLPHCPEHCARRTEEHPSRQSQEPRVVPWPAEGVTAVTGQSVPPAVRRQHPASVQPHQPAELPRHVSVSTQTAVESSLSRTSASLSLEVTAGGAEELSGLMPTIPLSEFRKSTSPTGAGAAGQPLSLQSASVRRIATRADGARAIGDSEHELTLAVSSSEVAREGWRATGERDPVLDETRTLPIPDVDSTQMQSLFVMRGEDGELVDDGTRARHPRSTGDEGMNGLQMSVRVDESSARGEEKEEEEEEEEWGAHADEAASSGSLDEDRRGGQRRDERAEGTAYLPLVEEACIADTRELLEPLLDEGTEAEDQADGPGEVEETTAGAESSTREDPYVIEATVDYAGERLQTSELGAPSDSRTPSTSLPKTAATTQKVDADNNYHGHQDTQDVHPCTAEQASCGSNEDRRDALCQDEAEDSPDRLDEESPTEEQLAHARDDLLRVIEERLFHLSTDELHTERTTSLASSTNDCNAVEGRTEDGRVSRQSSHTSSQPASRDLTGYARLRDEEVRRVSVDLSLMLSHSSGQRGSPASASPSAGAAEPDLAGSDVAAATPHTLTANTTTEDAAGESEEKEEEEQQEQVAGREARATPSSRDEDNSVKSASSLSADIRDGQHDGPLLPPPALEEAAAANQRAADADAPSADDDADEHGAPSEEVDVEEEGEVQDAEDLDPGSPLSRDATDHSQSDGTVHSGTASGSDAPPAESTTPASSAATPAEADAHRQSTSPSPSPSLRSASENTPASATPAACDAPPARHTHDAGVGTSPDDTSIQTSVLTASNDERPRRRRGRVLVYVMNHPREEVSAAAAVQPPSDRSTASQAVAGSPATQMAAAHAAPGPAGVEQLEREQQACSEASAHPRDCEAAAKVLWQQWQRENGAARSPAERDAETAQDDDRARMDSHGVAARGGAGACVDDGCRDGTENASGAAASERPPRFPPRVLAPTPHTAVLTRALDSTESQPASSYERPPSPVPSAAAVGDSASQTPRAARMTRTAATWVFPGPPPAALEGQSQCADARPATPATPLDVPQPSVAEQPAADQQSPLHAAQSLLAEATRAPRSLSFNSPGDTRRTATMSRRATLAGGTDAPRAPAQLADSLDPTVQRGLYTASWLPQAELERVVASGSRPHSPQEASNDSAGHGSAFPPTSPYTSSPHTLDLIAQTQVDASPNDEVNNSRDANEQQTASEVAVRTPEAVSSAWSQGRAASDRPMGSGASEPTPTEDDKWAPHPELRTPPANEDAHIDIVTEEAAALIQDAWRRWHLRRHPRDSQPADPTAAPPRNRYDSVSDYSSPDSPQTLLTRV